MLKAAGKTAYAVNPRAAAVDGDKSYPSLADLPAVPDVAVMVVPPAVTEAAVAECARLGIPNVWMQPGAEFRRGRRRLPSARHRRRFRRPVPHGRPPHEQFQTS